MEIYVGDKVIFRDCFGRRGEGEVVSVFGHICEVDTTRGSRILVAVNDILKPDGWREKDENRKTIIRDIDTYK